MTPEEEENGFIAHTIIYLNVRALTTACLNALGGVYKQ
jgi:hypothetical protein